MVFDEDIAHGVAGCPASLAAYLEDCLDESLLMDSVFCREAHHRACVGRLVEDLNQQMSALRLARETRDASLTLGRRFAALVAALHASPELIRLAAGDEVHHAVAFGYAFGVLQIDCDLSVGAFLHQCVLNTISAAQRLLPLGQRQANRIAWELKPAILDAVVRSRDLAYSAVCSFAHLPETASMRHPCLPTRLFVS